MLVLASAVTVQPLLAQSMSAAPEFLLLEVRLDQSVLSDAIPAYVLGEHTLLPLGELARLLTIAIKTQPGQGVASGYVLTEDRGFSLSLVEARVTRAGVTEGFDPALVLTEPDDIYVARSLLERWLPVELEVNRSTMSLHVHAVEALPLQARLKRERQGELAGTPKGYEDPGFPRHNQPYRLLGMPFIDQTFATELRRNEDDTQTDARYTAFLTGDLLGMESSLYFSGRKPGPAPDVRATLGRHDPDGNLLGPLRARSFQVGSISAPGVDNVTRVTSGEGATLSNRPLTQPTRFDRQVFEGDLPPGWDVELYYNDALVDFRQASAEGRYRFEDQPLSYGRNDFQLIFNGPLGQTRVEQYSFSLAQSMVRPGEFQYSLTEHRDDDGRPRSVALFDLGLSRSLTASAGFIRAPVDETDEQYTNLGLRTFWQAMTISGDYVQAREGGSLAELGLQTRVGGVAVDASRIRLSDFSSEVFPAYSDPVRTRDELRLGGSIPVGDRSRLPVTIEARRDERETGLADTDVSARVSAYVYRTAVSNTLRWRASGDTEQTLGTLQASRRVRDMSFRSQLNYTLGTRSDISALALTADKPLGEGYRMTLGVAHTFTSPQTRYTGGFTKSLGRYGLGVNASYADTGEITLGAQLFVAMGREPRHADWQFDARPMANSGAASVRMFLDDNNNGVMDDQELPLSGAGFTVNGGRHKARTNALGIAHIDHLPVKQSVDIGVDMATLEDPQWSPQVAGLNLVPRPGTVAELDFPVHLTTEIDGTVYLLENDVQRGIGDLDLELLSARHEVVGETTSSWDGFYIVSQVVAGEYWLRVSPKQLQRLGLTSSGMRKLAVSGEGSFISGVDFVITADGQQGEGRASPADAMASAPQGRDSFRTESWLRDQPPGNYTIQLMAASSAATVKQYIERHGLKHETAYAHTPRGGLPWYSLVYRSFTSYQAARTALEQLPPALAKDKPWVRRFEDIQSALAVEKKTAPGQ